jgi:hypothetical protein
LEFRETKVVRIFRTKYERGESYAGRGRERERDKERMEEGGEKRREKCSYL